MDLKNKKFMKSRKLLKLWPLAAKSRDSKKNRQQQQKKDAVNGNC